VALHHDLLEQAGHLARREPNRPRQASLRRAVSAAYYAVFHLLASEGAKLLGSTRPIGLRAQVQRGFAHRDMREVCRQFVAGSPAAPTRALITIPIESQLRSVCEVFLMLQDARHKADYDVIQAFDRLDALSLIEAAQTAFANWRAIRSTPNASVFLTALLLQRQWQ
jgi:hypothetical protein